VYKDIRWLTGPLSTNSIRLTPSWSGSPKFVGYPGKVTGRRCRRVSLLLN
jgi:hypothetical protein